MKQTFSLFAFYLSLTVAAQNPQTLVLDLATENPGSITQTIQPGEYKVELRNLLPTGGYSVAILLEDELLPTFATDALKPASAEKIDGDPCKPLADLEKEIFALEDEKQLPAKRAEIEQHTECAEYPAVKSRLKSLEYHSANIFTIKKSQKLSITVKRTTKDGKTLEWKRVYKTPARGQWLTCYSFNFVSPVMGKERSFFAKSVPNDTTFQITREGERKLLAFVPGITFTWLSSRGTERNWAIGGSGGVGFDLEKPVVFLGASLIYNQNLHFSLGFAAHQTRQLHGKYVEGQIIRENLTEDQLNITPYRVNPYFAVSLRFDKNPFKLGS